jgi:hypothetical protein
MGRRKNVPVLLNKSGKVVGRCGAGNKRCLARKRRGSLAVANER